MSEITQEETQEEESNLYEVFYKGEYNEEYMQDIFDLIHKLPAKSNLMIWTSSNGGSMHIGMMLKDKLESKELNVTFIYQMFNASMGVLMPQCGDFIRLAYPSSVFTFHAPSRMSRGSEDTFNSMTDYSTSVIESVKQMAMERTGLNRKEFKKYWGQDVLFYGYQLLDVGEHGWVDGLIQKELEVGVFLVKTRDGNKIIDASKHRRSDLKSIPVEE